MSGSLLPALIQILIQALAAGFPDTIDTYGLVSGLWTSTFALGAFIGPTLAGILFDSVGFPWATMLVIGVHIVVIGKSIFQFKISTLDGNHPKVS